MIPNELKYTEDHEWVSGPAGGVVRIGITDFAQQQLGDVVFVQLPEVGSQAIGGEAIGEVESTKSVSDIFAPFSGEVTAVNGALEKEPELVNGDPYGDGWMFEIRPAEAIDPHALLDAGGYEALTAES